MSTRKKLLISIASFSTIAILIIYSALSYRFGRSGAISRLQYAIKNKDAKTAAELIKSTDKNLTIDEKNISYFLDYMSSNKNDYKEMTENLQKQAVSINSKSNKNNNGLNYYITLKKSSRKFLFFDTYYFEMIPCYTYFKINYASTKLYVDGKYICTSDADDYSKLAGPFVPGMHKVTTICETIFGKSQNNDNFNFLTNYCDEKSKCYYVCYTTVKGRFAKINCNYDDAEVFLNGKDSGKTIKSFTAMGPLDSGTSNTISLQKEFPWGISRTENLDMNKLSNSDTIIISGITDKLLKALKSTVTEFNNSLAVTLSTQNTSNLRCTNENEASAINSVINNMRSENLHFNGRYLRSDITTDTLWASNNSEGADYLGQYMAVFECTDYYDTDFSNTNAEVYILKTSKKGCRNVYTLNYDTENNKWTISSIQFTGEY